jgi:uncharacterized membrane protein
MRTIEKTIEVERPVSTVYDQWIHFQDYPQFMRNIKEVLLIDDKHLRWKAEIWGKTQRWDAEIVEQVPNQRIQWRSTCGAENSGAVTFVPLTSAKTRVILYLTYQPKGIVEILGDNLGLLSTKVAADLSRFKEFMESRIAAVNNGHIVEALQQAHE